MGPEGSGGRDYARRLREVLEVRCVHLRTKAAYLPFPQQADLENPFDTAVWWCSRTCRALGPDGSTAAPGSCDLPGRECYEAPPGCDLGR